MGTANTQKCAQCAQIKSLTEAFYYFRKDRNIYNRKCKVCVYNQKTRYNNKNKEKIKEIKRHYYLNNKENICNNRKEYYINNREYRIANREKLNRQDRDNLRRRRNENPEIKLRHNVSRIISHVLFKNGGSKNGHSVLQYLPFSAEHLKQHLEYQFEDWMNWSNYGRYFVDKWDDNDFSTWTWQIDHIIPQSKLPYDSMNHPNFQKCWALGNLRPFSSKENLLKGNR